MRDFAIILVSVALGATGQILFKVGMQSFGQVTITGIWTQLIGILSVPYIPVGFLCFGVSSILWLAIVSKLELSYAYPMVSLGYVIVILASWWLLREELSFLRLLGVAFICAGVALVSKS
jgi:drug/metabolite transporter (DMT)-like permease